MNKVVGLAALVTVFAANVSQAVVVVRPGRPLRPIRPIVVRPPVVVRPPIVIRPPVILPPIVVPVPPPIYPPMPPAYVDYQFLGQTFYVGAGPRMENIHAQFRRADVVRVTMPVGCALTIQPQFQGEYSMVGGGIPPRVFNDGRNQTAIFRVGYNGNTVLRTVFLGINSVYYHGYERNCVVTVETGLEYR